MQGRIKRIAIICGYSFPQGLAATTRILAYSKGLVENGIKTDVFVYFPTDNVKSSLPVKGQVNGINYYYPKTRVHPRNKIFRLASHVYYCFVSIACLLKEHKKEKFDFVILSTDWFRILYAFIPIIRLMGSIPIFIADEYPTPIRLGQKEYLPIWKRISFKLILQHVKGMVFITEKLSSFYNEIVSRPSLILATITDVAKFSIKKDNYNGPRYLCYMGNMELAKDDIENIIEAFKIISSKYKDVELHLYGGPSEHDLKKINSVILKLELQNKVLIKGKVGSDKVPYILANSYVLLSSSRATKRVEGGLSTKFGEYMSTGIPALFADVGVINGYIIDGKTGWLARPNDPNHFAQKLEYIIDNYTEAMQVAQNAREFILNNFDYKIQATRLIAFFNDLLVSG